MMGAIYLLIVIFSKYARQNESFFYQEKRGHWAEWITPDEWIKRSKEYYFYLNQIGGTRHESIKRNFTRTN